MREVPKDKQFDRDEKTTTGPSEAELVQISLLMRLYDLNLAILAHFDQERADEVYEAHARGENFNPQVFIPDFGDAEEG